MTKLGSLPILEPPMRGFGGALTERSEAEQSGVVTIPEYRASPVLPGGLIGPNVAPLNPTPLEPDLHPEDIPRPLVASGSAFLSASG